MAWQYPAKYYLCPLEGGVIVQRPPIRGAGIALYEGWYIQKSTNDTVYSPFSGNVIRMNHEIGSLELYGPEGKTKFFGIFSLRVLVGQKIKIGDPIGSLAGNSGIRFIPPVTNLRCSCLNDH